MEFRDNARIDNANVRYGGGGGGRRGGRGIAVGGGIGGLIITLLLLVFGGGNLGINPDDILGGGQAQPSTVGQNPECQTGADIDTNPDCRWPAYVVAIENYWSQVVEGYQPGTTQLFTGQVATACGTGSSEMGPFYCPGDQTIYIDTEFMGVLLNQLGAAGGYAAEAYIVAHEYGHHISNLTGTMQQARSMGNDTGPTSGQVRLELQADCYAGVWFNNTLKDPQSPIESITQDDLNRIVDAARAVGDDHIQEQQGGRVVPESWTHGSSEMRQLWVAKGFNSGDPNVCDTFSTDDLGQ
ncbi:KPN_02809 family neutral zinc metallopeptidase [Tessaracoccus sp. Z1128]